MRIAKYLWLWGLLGNATQASSATSNTKSWKLLHSSNGQDFVPRGKVTLSIIAPDDVTKEKWDGENEDAPSSSASSLSPKVELEIVNQEDAFTVEMVNSMVSNDGALYQVKLIEEGQDHSKQSTSAILATVPACQVRRANFRYVTPWKESSWNTIYGPFVHLCFTCIQHQYVSSGV